VFEAAQIPTKIQPKGDTMLKRQLGTLFLVTCLILTTVPAVLGGENKQVITVAGNGRGDFNCDGKDDHVQINQALDYAASHPGTTVHLEGPYTYFIGDTLRIGSNTILEGESGVTIKLAPGLNKWGGPGSKPANEKAMLMIKNNSAKNVTIRNLTVDGSQKDYYPKVSLGAYYFNMATLIGVTGLTIQNVTFQNGCNDAMLITTSSNILIDTVTVNKCGHDGVYAYNLKNITVKNFKFINRANSSTRFDTVTNGVFANNDCTTSGGGFAGLELENKVTSIECTGNYFHDMPWGISRVHTSENNVNIHGNRYVNVKNGVSK
jgi:polygalacturonase